jgi:hypothetical protein
MVALVYSLLPHQSGNFACGTARFPGGQSLSGCAFPIWLAAILFMLPPLGRIVVVRRAVGK